MDLEYYILDYSFSKYPRQITFILRLINEAKNHNPLIDYNSQLVSTKQQTENNQQNILII